VFNDLCTQTTGKRNSNYNSQSQYNSQSSDSQSSDIRCAAVKDAAWALLHVRHSSCRGVLQSGRCRVHCRQCLPSASYQVVLAAVPGKQCLNRTGCVLCSTCTQRCRQGGGTPKGNTYVDFQCTTLQRPKSVCTRVKAGANGAFSIADSTLPEMGDGATGAGACSSPSHEPGNATSYPVAWYPIP
jgi:hypothetical protein